MNKKATRIRRARKTRAKIALQRKPRLLVYRTLNHIYAQIILPENKGVCASASTLDKQIKASLNGSGNIEAAKKVGQLVASRAKKKKIHQVAFDRNGFRYHGRVKALADAARETGLEF
jgi:large subunit ribosomal protein L18